MRAIKKGRKAGAKPDGRGSGLESACVVNQEATNYTELQSLPVLASIMATSGICLEVIMLKPIRRAVLSLTATFFPSISSCLRLQKRKKKYKLKKSL